MKKNSLFICLLLISISFGQTKKKKIDKKTKYELVEIQKNDQKETEKESPKEIQINMIDDYYNTETGNSENENSVYRAENVQVKPEFNGGNNALKKYLKANLKIEPVEGEKQVGKVYVAFVVEKGGNLTDLKVLRDLGHGTKEEVLRVCKMMPKWKAAFHNGAKVRCYYTLPVEIN